MLNSFLNYSQILSDGKEITIPCSHSARVDLFPHSVVSGFSPYHHVLRVLYLGIILERWRVSDAFLQDTLGLASLRDCIQNVACDSSLVWRAFTCSG